MIDKGEKFNNLYILDTATMRTNAASLNEGVAILKTYAVTSIMDDKTFANNVSIQVWHNKLGHLSLKRLEILKNKIYCDTTKFNKASVPCYICPLAKQRSLSFVSFNYMVQFPFDLNHCDIWGPYHIPSHTGHRYFLSLVDDCTRFI